MDIKKQEGNNPSEINLKDFLKRVLQNWYLFAFSLALFMSLAYVYIKWATPIYEVSTSILIDDSGNSRKLGESKYVEGDVGLIDTKKNIFNEIGIIRSHSLVKQTLEELDYNISYHAGDWFRQKEYFQDFPFEVTLVEDSPQMINIPIRVKPVAKDKYRIIIETEKFNLLDPNTEYTQSIATPFKYNKVHTYGEAVNHDYFNIIINKSDKVVAPRRFNGLDLSFQVHSYNNMANAYLGSKISVERTDIKGSILRINSRGAVPNKEIAFLQKLTYNYVQSKFGERDKIATSKQQFIEDQLKSVADSLARAEKKLAEFKSGANAVDLDRTAHNALDRVEDLEIERGQIELNIKYYNSLLTYVRENEHSKIVAPSVVGIDDPLLNENLLELKRLESERARSSFYKGKKSYDLEILDKQIRNTTKSLEENIDNLVKSSKIAWKDKTERIKKFERSISKLPKSEKQLIRYERKRALHENLYNYLSQELAKTGIALAENLVDTRVLDEARMVNSSPVSPQKSMIMLLAMMVGLMLPLSWIVLTDSFNNSIETIKALEQNSSIPLLASVAHAKANASFFGRNDLSWEVKESFRDFSANLQLLVPESHKNVIGITSMIPGEGKTFCAINLALSLAKTGKKVLLIDADMRSDSPLKDSSGASGLLFWEYLQGKRAFDKNMIKRHFEEADLFHLPIKIDYEDAPELLNSSRFKIMIKDIKKSYDYVIIDTPAVGVVSDYLFIVETIDIHLFILRRGISNLASIRDIENLQEKGKIKELFLVFNDVKKGAFKKGYSYKPRRSII